MVAMDKAGKGIHLIGTQFVARIEIARDALGDGFGQTAPAGKGIEFFVEEFCVRGSVKSFV